MRLQRLVLSSTTSTASPKVKTHNLTLWENDSFSLISIYKYFFTQFIAHCRSFAFSARIIASDVMRALYIIRRKLKWQVIHNNSAVRARMLKKNIILFYSLTSNTWLYLNSLSSLLEGVICRNNFKGHSLCWRHPSPFLVKYGQSQLSSRIILLSLQNQS